MKTKSLLKLFSAICLAAVIAIPFVVGCAGPAPAPVPTPVEATYHWRLGGTDPDPASLSHKGGDLFCKRVKELSDGRMDIKFYTGDLLGDYIFCTEQVAIGALDFNLSVAPTILDPRLNMASLGYVGFDREAARKAFGPGGWAVETCSDIAEGINWKLLGLPPEGFNSFVSSIEFTPVPEEVKAKGIKTRVMPMETEKLMAEAFGFSPMVIPWSEVYMALLTGIVDVASGQIPHIINFTELTDALQPQPYYYNYKYTFGYLWLICNLDLWGSISAQDQQILLDAAGEVTESMWSGLEKQENDFREGAPGAGWVIFDLTPEQFAANVKTLRDTQWPYMEEVIGKRLMDTIKANAQAIPE